MNGPGCYERTAQAERKSALQGSGLVRTVGPCAHSRVPRAIATASDALSNDQRKAPRPSAHVHGGTNGQSCPGRILFMHELCLYVL